MEQGLKQVRIPMNVAAPSGNVGTGWGCLHVEQMYV
jgi:hypothetical protein